MNKIRISIIVIAIWTFTVPAHAIVLGYVTGNDYLKFDNENRVVWLIGVMDGIMAESTIIKKDDKGPWLGRCIDGLSKDQIKAMFEKELTQHPEGWHAPAGIIFRVKMKDFCKDRIEK